jgi:hypothetical protein
MTWFCYMLTHLQGNPTHNPQKKEQDQNLIPFFKNAF